VGGGGRKPPMRRLGFRWIRGGGGAFTCKFLKGKIGRFVPELLAKDRIRPRTFVLVSLVLELCLFGPTMHGYGREGAYRVSDTARIRIRHGYTMDTYPGRTKKNGYVLNWIRVSDTLCRPITCDPWRGEVGVVEEVGCRLLTRVPVPCHRRLRRRRAGLRWRWVDPPETGTSPPDTDKREGERGPPTMLNLLPPGTFCLCGQS
jgi:hypothetical protein